MPASSIRIFYGFRSRCTTFLLCMNWTAAITCLIIFLVVSSEELKCLVNLFPEAYSVTIKIWKSSVKAVYSLMILGCCMRLHAYSSTRSCSSILYSYTVDLNIFFSANKKPVYLCLSYSSITCIRGLIRICRIPNFVLFQTSSSICLLISRLCVPNGNLKIFVKLLAR